MTNPTLVILAAGMGSRYGGLKQIDAVGPNGQTIIDYSVYDAIQAGFGKVVFIIREDFAEDFKNKVSNKFLDAIEVVLVYQTLDTGFDHLPCPEGRTKPWGTGHAMLAAKDYINEPFAVINADDYYGQSGFSQAYNFLIGLDEGSLSAMMGYSLIKTLSENGHVNRGVCLLDENYFLEEVIEREKIIKTNQGIFFGGEENKDAALSPDTIVSMNFWLFHQDIFEEIGHAFERFLEEKRLVEKSEFYIPIFVDELIREEMLQVLVLTSEDSWYGVTYQKDKPSVVTAMQKLHNEGRYPAKLV